MDAIITTVIIIIALIIIASTLAQDIIAPILAIVQEKLNKRFGFPRNVKTGEQGLINQIATVKTVFSKEEETGCLEGRITVRGEQWKARFSSSESPVLKPGDKVRVVGVQGLTLEIEPIA